MVARYPPWAVLFGLTERWVGLGRQLASKGQVPPLEQSLGIDEIGSAELVERLTTLTASLRTSRDILARLEDSDDIEQAARIK